MLETKHVTREGIRYYDDKVMACDSTGPVLGRYKASELALKDVRSRRVSVTAPGRFLGDSSIR